MLTLIDAVSETVRQSLTTFAEDKLQGNADRLSDSLVSEVTKGLDEAIHEAARAGLKAFIEQFETEDKQIARDGLIWRLNDEASNKKFLTIFGEIEVTRRYYHCAKADKANRGLVPLDESWNMQGRYATAEVVEHLLWLSGMLVPKDVNEACTRLRRAMPSISCIQDIISSDGKGIANMLEAADGAQCRGLEVPEQTEVFVASLDGVNVLLREKGTKKGRPAESPIAVTAAEKSGDSSYKNAMVGSFSFYTQVDGVLDIESGLEGIVAERLSSFYCARMPEENFTGLKKDSEAILAIINEELDQTENEVTRIVLMDGARPLWKFVENSPAFKGYRLLLDFFHASEHLSQAAEALFGKQSEQAKNWYKKWRFKLKYEKDAVARLLRSIAYHEKSSPLSKSRQEDLNTQIVFFTGNKARMNYHEHIANGWPIGSGPVEAACKTIVKARLCQSGMRWSREGGRHILALRTLTKSNQWDHVWNRYYSQHWQNAAA